MKSRNPALWFVFVTLLLDVLGFGLLIPVGPRFVMQLQGGDEAAAAPIVGWLGATYATMQFLFAPLLGALSDRFGRRPVLLVSLFGSGLDYLVMPFVPSVPWLFVTRVVNGISGASITVCNAYIADITAPDRRAAAFGVVGAAFGVGFVLGPLLGGILGGIDIHLPFYVAGAVTLVNWLFGFLVVPESLPAERRKSAFEFRWNPLAGLSRLARYPLVLRLAGASFLINLAQFALHATWVLYTGYRYHWDETDAGYSLFAVGIGAIVVQGGLARRLVPKLGERRALLLGFTIAACAYFGYATATAGWMIYVVIGCASFGGLAMPAMQSLVTRTVRSDEQGLVQGGLSSVQGLANIFGPLLGSTVFAWSISGALQPPLPGAVYFTSGVIALLALGCVAYAVRGLPAAAPR